ncbi:MAG: DHHW family protein [Erysipelotrichaceae bacterium]|nr:DHHW family protein [Erysipelotrichaceae bacterium]
MKHKIISFTFVGLLLGVMICNIILPDQEISKSERRKLTQFPTVTLSSIMDGSWQEKWERYTNDQFIARDWFRMFESIIRTNVLHQLDDQGVFMYDDQIYKMDHKIDQKSLDHFVSCIQTIQNQYLTKENQAYYAIIPDKNYYQEDAVHLKLDYEQVFDYLQSQLQLQEIVLTDCLSSEDYYATDLHWRQEKLDKVVERLSDTLQLNLNRSYQQKTYDHFFGAYASQFPQAKKPDQLIYLTNDILDEAVVSNIEQPNVTTVYDEAKLTGVDSYDVFLSGPTALTVIENPNAENDRELILFRDSFGSSLAPLLVEGYQKITLVDIRYVSSSLLDQWITFDDQDILFLYSVPIVNQSFTLRK